MPIRTLMSASLRTMTLVLALPTGAFAQGAEISWRKDVNLKVGESMVVYGYRGDCGQRPDLSQVRVPATRTGQFSFGQMGVRQSNRCGGTTPAIELVFTATAPGRETVKVQGDEIRIRVMK